MAKLMAEMTIKIHPEMSDEGKAMLRQMIREELEAYLKEQVGKSPQRYLYAHDKPAPHINTQSLETK